MIRPLAVLRPEPGNAVTAARIEKLGLETIRLPLFEVRPLDWTPPDSDAFDALFLTSANAPRLAGADLEAFARLPVYAVGGATRAAAQAAGLNVVHIGERAGIALLEAAATQGIKRGLLLSGREHVLVAGGPIARVIAVYASDPLPVFPADTSRLAGSVALLHSRRAAQRLAELVDSADRPGIRIAAISPAVAEAAGPGWDATGIADVPDDDTLIAAATALTD